MKKWLSVALLVFVGASIVKLVLNANQEGKPNDAAPGMTAGTQTMVYYFHGNVRCKTCNTIEAYTRQTVQGKFADQVEGGALVMRVINMDGPGNGRYVDDYQLTSSSVVVAQVKEGTELKWRRLDEVWDLVRDEAAFASLIENEIRSAMEGVE